jgi:undecaprenyl-diphosphatase
MGFARIFVGVHWPADILGGVLVGIISAIGVNFLLRRIFLRKQGAKRGVPDLEAA